MIAAALLKTLSLSLSESRDKVTNIRYGKITRGGDTILFDFDGVPHIGVLRGRNQFLVLSGDDRDKSLAFRVLLDGHAKRRE